MAVVIDEMHVDVQEAPPSAAPAAAGDEQKKDVSLSDALQILHERKLRLKAD